MHQSSKTRDFWDVVEIVGKGVVVPIMIALVGLYLRDRIASLEERTATAGRDVTLMTQFQAMYSERATRRLARFFVDRIEAPDLREQLRRFMVWDLLEANLSRREGQPPPATKADAGVARRLGEPPRPQGFIFDPEVDDWHLLGEVVWEMKEDPQERARFESWWSQDVKAHVLSYRWPRERGELQKLFAWVEGVYLSGKGRPA